MIFLSHLKSLFNCFLIQWFNNAENNSNANNFRSWEIHEIFVTSKSNNMSEALQKELQENLWIKGIKSLSVHRNYLIEWLTDNEFDSTTRKVFSEAPVDNVFDEATFQSNNIGNKLIVIESAPGQYDPRVDAVDKNIALVTWKTDTRSRYKDVISIDGNVSKKDMEKIKKYLINPNEKIESKIDQKSFQREIANPINHFIIEGFTDIDTTEGFKQLLKKHSDIAIEIEDIEMVRDYFKDVEDRDPTKVELLLIGTYWSDHCRHTTFETQIEHLEVSGIKWFVDDFKKFRANYKEKSLELGKTGDTFMQIATSSLRFLKDDPDFKGANLLDTSEEDNAASFKLQIELDNWKTEDWIFMFKNETHNSPTNSEPFGWAATCLWWAIRDTASGRAFTFAAARVTWAGDPTEPISDTMFGLISQRALSIWAALWYASYGNQIWLAATQVREYFHPGYKAKRFEMWIVLAAVKEENIDRRTPVKDDLIIQFGGPVGRDGIWWATVSSKVSWSLDDKKMWAHVQKWNPVEERKFQRLLLNPKFTKMIKKSNDFWAGWVSVALWELSRWAEIDLDRIAKHSKYDGLSDAELMISESQERMSIVISPEDAEEVLRYLEEENIVWFVAGKITDDPEDSSKDRLTVKYKGKKVVDLSRDFLDKNGADRKHDAIVKLWEVTFFDTLDKNVQGMVDKWDFMWAFKAQLWLLVNASQKWLQAWFDSSVGASTIHAPYGWKYQNSPQAAMVSKIPTFEGVDSKTAIISAHGFNPYLLSENTYIWGMYTILETVSKIVATGWDHKESWFSLQEYFGKLTSDEKYWEVYAWLLGTLKVLTELKIAAIGGKDSMSGSHKLPELLDRVKEVFQKQWIKGKLGWAKNLIKSLIKWEKVLDVPPTIVWVGNAPVDSEYAVSSEFKRSWNSVLCFPIERDENGIPDLKDYAKKLEIIESLVKKKKVLSSNVVGQWWIMHTITNLCLWNKIGFVTDKTWVEMLTPNIGDIIIEIDWDADYNYQDYIIWNTTSSEVIYFWGEALEIDEAEKIMNETLNWVWNTDKWEWKVESIDVYRESCKHDVVNILREKPVALIPVFPGTNSELDTRHALLKEWFEVIEHVFNDIGTIEEQAKSRKEFAEKLKATNMLVVPGGFSWWDEPWASGIGAVNILKSEEIRSPLQEFFDKKDTLSIWICNGAQILNKLWVIDNGEITDELQEDDTIITHNKRLNHETWLVRNKITSILSPFFREENTKTDYMINMSHGEGNFQVSDEKLKEYIEKGQIALQYRDEEGNTTNKYNGSKAGIAAMTSPDGRILITMPHPERVWLNTAKNVPWEKLLPIFKNAFEFFKWRHWIGGKTISSKA